MTSDRNAVPRTAHCRSCEEETDHYPEPMTDVSIAWWCKHCERRRSL
jgi:hypothetical protein